MDDNQFLKELGVTDKRGITTDDVMAAITLTVAIGCYIALFYLLEVING